MAQRGTGWSIRNVLLTASILFTGVSAENILKTNGFTICGGDSNIQVHKIDITYNSEKRIVTFDVSGTNKKSQNVTAALDVTAYGKSVYQRTFNPCQDDTFVEQLCPLPIGTFSANGTQEIPEEWAKQIPDIAYQVPDIAAQARLELTSLDSGDNVACIESQVTNGKTFKVAAVPYVAAGVAGAALLVTGASAAGAVMGGYSAGAGGAPSPSFIEMFGWFQSIAMNGMMSVNYPPIYRSFANNFGFSAGLISWTPLQVAIDDFRARTGGDLSRDGVDVLRNSTLVFPDGSVASDSGVLKVRRALGVFATLIPREFDTAIDNGASGDNSTSLTNMPMTVSGISAYVQQLSVPKSNTFMTVLLVIAIVIASIVVGILLVKVILEIWALFGNFPKALAGFRTHYWGSIARTITSLILLLYGIWVMYAVFQFTQGDSWAAKTLAGVTLAIFTGILIFFSWRIWNIVRKLKETEGTMSGLYDDKDHWVKYSLFYDAYKKSYWWIFVPTIIYMLIKGCTLAVADGHGMAQAITLLVVEACMLVLLLWSRPYERRSGTIINIAIQVVRVLSVVCILVFVEEFGIAQTTQTVTGVVLIAAQSTLTGILAILIMWNGINACCKENPHRKRRKEMGKFLSLRVSLMETNARYREVAARDGQSDSTRRP